MAGSGVTFHSIVRDLRNNLVNEYELQLQRLGVKGKRMDDMRAGFRDGFNNAVRMLVEMEVIALEKDPQEEQQAPEFTNG